MHVSGGISVTEDQFDGILCFCKPECVQLFPFFHDISIICVTSLFSYQGWRWWWWCWCYSDDKKAFQHYLASNNWIFLTRCWDILQPKKQRFLQRSWNFKLFLLKQVEYFRREVWTLCSGKKHVFATWKSGQFSSFFCQLKTKYYWQEAETICCRKQGFFLKEEFKNTMLSVSCALTRAEAQRNRNTKLRTEPKEQL